MVSVLVNLLILALSMLFFWWLSGYDPRLTTDSEKENFIRRAVRCAITSGLVELLLWELRQYTHYQDQSAVLSALFTLFLLAFIWCGCLSNCAAHSFVALVDPEDKRKFDPKTELHKLDMIGELIRTGNKTAAIELCESLKTSGEVSLSTLEFTLEHLGVPQAGTRTIRPLVAASRLRSEGKFREAELILNSVLAANPRDLEAAMTLVRLYAQDLRQPQKATGVLRELEKQPHIPSAHIQFAHSSITEWSQLPPGKTEVIETPKIESVDELLAQGFFGTATEMLETKIKEQPQDFESRLKLAEIHGVHCANFPRAEKIVRQIEMDFNPEQVQLAKKKLAEWREMQPRH